MVLIEIFSRLIVIGHYKGPPEGINEITYREKDTNARKYRLRRREHLPHRYQKKITDRSIDVHQSDAFTERLRERVKNVNRWVEPPSQSLIGIWINLASKQVQDGGGRIA